MPRSYRGGDEQAIVDLWNRACPADPMSMDVFTRRVLVDPNFDPEGLLVAEEQGQVVGALLAIVRKIPLSGSDLEPDNGWITFFFVDPNARGRGYATALLEAAVQFFQARGRKHIFFSSYAPNYFVPGMDAHLYPAGKRFLEKHGFRVLYPAVAMDKNLVGFSYPDDVRAVETARVNEGYVFEPLTHRYLTDVIRFNDEVFNPDWARAIRDAVAQGVSLEQILIARYGERVVGFCMYGAYDGVGERFGPFGVDPDLRGTGLGKVLLYKCLHVMRAAGLHNAWFLWTGEKSPAGHLYFRAGFEITRRFEIMKRDL
ncbi:MAG: GNAT family N-acetyltransferase [Alicyclobacillus shizuokensis]|nr:GNAT family N-acetyltransferase [Alicyclobacillus shizuokensis]